MRRPAESRRFRRRYHKPLRAIILPRFAIPRSPQALTLPACAGTTAAAWTIRSDITDQPKGPGGALITRLPRTLRSPSLALAAICTVAFPMVAGAQSITTGSLRGVVRSSEGNPIAEAFVTLTEQSSGSSRFLETDPDGRFVFVLLPPGAYELFAEQLRYRPVRATGIVIEAGASLKASIALSETDPPVVTIDTVAYPAGAAVAEPGAARTIPPSGVDQLSWPGREMADLTALSPVSGSAFEHEGLPSAYSAVAVDGVPVGVSHHPYLPSTSSTLSALPQWAFESVKLNWSPTDAEWGGLAGAVLNGSPKRGSAGLEMSLFADWGGNAGASSTHFSPNASGHSSVRGGALISGAIIPDTLHFTLGAEARRLQTPLPPAWAPTAVDSTILATAQSAYGRDIGASLQGPVAEQRAISGFGRLDGQIGGGALRAWVSFGRVREDNPPVGPWGIQSVSARREATDIVASASYASSFSQVVAQELRVGFSRTEAKFSDTASVGTRIGSSVLAFGTDPAQPGTLKRTDFGGSETLHLALGNFRVKLGFQGGFTSHDRAFTFGSAGEYLFSDEPSFGSGDGQVYAATGSPLPTTFSTLTLGGLFQNTWDVTDRLSLIFGLRWDGEFLPAGEVPLSQDWLDQTGLRSDALDGSQSRFSPRFGFRWSFGETDDWIVSGGAGVHHGTVDPAVLGELLAETGRVSVWRGVGTVGWSADPAGALVGQEVGARLTMLGPDYQSPRSSRFRFGIARRLGRSGALELAASYRHTDFLPRRHDINLLPAPAAVDQYGRPVYGDLVQTGGLVAAAAGSNRRFDGFELVSVLDADGYSDYWALTARLDMPAGRFLRLLGSYAYSRTTDNWLSGRYGGPYAQLTPFPDSLGQKDWAKGRSDADVPHRLAVGIELLPLGRAGVSLAALIRYRSGLPYTPGFRYGVDVNGDGSPNNDPAFVDGQIAGVDAILTAEQCLRGQVGSFAERNVCRDPGVATVNLRLGLGPYTLAGYPIELWVEALNVTDTELAVRDHALYLVERNTALVKDPVAGTVTVPLVANDDFGKPLAQRGTGRALRFGLRVNY